MVDHLFYQRNSYNILFYIRLKIFCHMKLNFFLTQLKFSSLTRKFLSTLNFSLTFAINFVKPIEFSWEFSFL